MGERGNFTAGELALAKSVDLTAVAACLGYTVKRIGRYHTLQEMDSIRIYGRRSWFRWSREHERGSNGGSQIDFLRVFAGMEVKDAVFWLLDFAGYRRDGRPEKNALPCAAAADGEKGHPTEAGPSTDAKKKPFVLPAPAGNNDRLYSYLTGERALGRHTVDYFVDRGLIYEEQAHHNIVFKGNDAQGNTRFAGMRGTYDRDGKAFKCDVAGSDKNYGFNVRHGDSEEVMVFEAAIDLMSHAEIRGGYEADRLALGMLSDAPLATFLGEHPQIKKISFCLDNDGPGRRAAEALMGKYYGLGYEVEDCPPPKQHKDYNEWLQAAKRHILHPAPPKTQVR